MIRLLKKEDIPLLGDAFEKQGWGNRRTTLEAYFDEQAKGIRDVYVAEIDGILMGYLTILWVSDYNGFKDSDIPEITDLNVLIDNRGRGIASLLMDKAEDVVSKKYSAIGISVGLFSDYGNAQRLYVKRGYIPDGKGIYSGGRYLGYGESVLVDDDLILSFVKDF